MLRAATLYGGHIKKRINKAVNRQGEGQVREKRKSREESERERACAILMGFRGKQRRNERS